jgi:hypothetical protein
MKLAPCWALKHILHVPREHRDEELHRGERRSPRPGVGPARLGDHRSFHFHLSGVAVFGVWVKITPQGIQYPFFH